MKQQYVRTPFLPGWDQVSLETFSRQSGLGLRLEGPGNSKTVALTFDDGPGRHTLDVLRVLARNRVKATFFMLGHLVEQRPYLAREVINSGHCLGNHTYNHQRADRSSDFKLLVGQVLKTEKIFQNVLGAGSNIYRPAYGAISDAQINKMTLRGYHCFAWSIDTQDWYFNSIDQIYSMVADHLHPEAVVLMHDGGGNRINTVRALQMIINECRRQGYRFTTLDKYVGKPLRKVRWK